MKIVGIDEVGRGVWAGPLTAVAVLIDDSFCVDGVTDSKKLTKKRRELLLLEIQKQACSIGIGWVNANELDEVGLSEANRLAMYRALLQIDQEYDELLIDGNIAYLPNAKTIIQGDSKELSIGAASIVAKVLRDRYMVAMSNIYPGYGFDKHVGYGTAVHKQAIEKLGITKLHRKSFKPIRIYI